MVDEVDRVIGQATRQEIHRRHLLHRSAHILVFNSNNEIFIQKRSMVKDESPGLWDTSSAGHVDSGEDYEECAHRELWEELGVKGVLIYFARISACRETHQEHVQIFTCKTDKEITINQNEISEGRFCSLNSLEREIQFHPEQFTSSFKLIMSLFVKH